MTLDKYTKEQLEEISMVELAYEILIEEKKAMHFNELFDLITEAKGLTQSKKEEFIAQFYTDLNIDGKILSVGSNMWGIKAWYPYEQSEDDILPFNEEEEEKPKKKKKKKKKKDEFIDEGVLIGDAEDYDLETDDMEDADIYDDDDDDGADFSEDDDEELYDDEEDEDEEDDEFDDEDEEDDEK
ncbi:DNA-directed RNA polymerase subunit delta [Bacillaceae bacterium W0354]